MPETSDSGDASKLQIIDCRMQIAECGIGRDSGAKQKIAALEKLTRPYVFCARGRACRNSNVKCCTQKIIVILAQFKNFLEIHLQRAFERR
jgi:hypothetical protein